ncbi:MAG: hypothetical protein ACR2KP_04630, partial [Egibacteraceae bacterium]
MMRSAPLKRSRRPRQVEGPLPPEDWRLEVLAADGWRSRLSGRPAAPGDPLEAHHCVPKRTLRRRGLYGWVWVP